MEEMKDKIKSILKDNGGKCYLLSLVEMVPGSAGEYAIYMSVKKGVNPNILWVSNVSKEFIQVFNYLLYEEKSITFEVVNIWELAFDGLPIYSNIKIADKSDVYGKKEVWLPVNILLQKAE